MATVNLYETAQWDGSCWDTFRWDQWAPETVHELGHLEAWERDPDWPELGSAPLRVYKVTTDGTGTSVSLKVDAGPVEETVVTVSFAADASAAAIDSAFLGEGYTVTTVGSDGSYEVSFDDYTVDDALNVMPERAGSILGMEMVHGGAGLFPNAQNLYRIDVVETGGTDYNMVLAEVLRWGDGGFKDKVNEPGVLTFRVNARDTEAVGILMDRGNRIVLRDRWGMVLCAFRIMQRSKRRDGDGIWLTLTAESLLVQFEKESVREYKKTPGEGATVAEAVVDL